MQVLYECISDDVKEFWAGGMDYHTKAKLLWATELSGVRVTILPSIFGGRVGSLFHYRTLYSANAILARAKTVRPNPVSITGKIQNFPPTPELSSHNGF